jgi:prepilin-type N-terminal cleavage/methylation domain-containing protein
MKGFSLIELLVAVAILTLATSTVFVVLSPAHGIFASQGEQSDLQQRARVGIDALFHDLMMAGAGPYSGAPLGPLNSLIASVLPYRLGTVNPDPAGRMFYRAEAITVLFVPTTSSQTTVRDSMSSAAAEIPIDILAGCPIAEPACGFDEGMRVLIVDDTGAFDTFTVTAVGSANASLMHEEDPLSRAYRMGSLVSEVSMLTYWLKPDPGSGTFQLMRYDGYRSDSPVIDHVASLVFEYYGEAVPPRLRRPVTDPVGPWTTYGPRPPPVDVDDARDSWPAGENCVFRVDPLSSEQVPRLLSMASELGVTVSLGAEMLTDGPWCPDASAANRFDADLLRVRRIRVTLRVESAVASLRGPAGVLFRRGGTSRAAERLVPDQEIRFDVTPRNLNLGR